MRLLCQPRFYHRKLVQIYKEIQYAAKKIKKKINFLKHICIILFINELQRVIFATFTSKSDNGQ